MSKFITRRKLTNPAIQAVVCTILLLVLNYACFYIDGIRGRMSCSVVMIFNVIPLYYILMLLLAVRAVIGVCTSFWRIKAISQESIMSVVVFIIVTTAPLAAFFAISPGAEIFIRGYKHWALKHVDIDLIQDWIVKAPDFYWNELETYSSIEGKPEGFPQCLKDYEFQYVSFEQSDLDGSKVVRLEWGGGMSHWGVVVGSPQMKMPDKTEYEINKSSVEFRKVIKPGAYVYERG